MASYNFPPRGGSGGGSEFWGDAVANFAALPSSGNVDGEIRLTLDSDKLYRWDGVAWVEYYDPDYVYDGSPNTFAYYNASGNLDDLPNRTVEPNFFGVNESLTINPDNDGTVNVNNLELNITPLQNSPNDSFTHQLRQLIVDPTATGFDIATNGSINEEYVNIFANQGAGNAGTIYGKYTNASIGNGTNAYNLDGIRYNWVNGSIASPSVVDSVIVSGSSLSSSAGSSIQSYTGFLEQNNFDTLTNEYAIIRSESNVALADVVRLIAIYGTYDEATNGFGGLDIGPTIGDSTYVNGLYFHPNVTGTITSFQGSEIGLGIANVTGNVNGFTVSGSITSSTGDLNMFSAYPIVTSIAGNVNGFSLSPTISGTANSFTGVNLTGSIDSLTNSYMAVNVGANIAGTVDGYFAFNISGNIDTVSNNYNAINVGLNIADTGGFYGFNLGGTVTTFDSFSAGVQITPTTTGGTGDFTGINVSTSNVVTSGNVRAIQSSGATDLNGKFNSFHSQTIVDGGGSPSSINSMISAPTIGANQTVANSDTIAFNTAALIQIGDNSVLTSGAFGLGQTVLGFPAVITMGAGSSMDYLAAAVFALSLDAAATGGTIGQSYGCRAVVIPNGATTITRHYGYFHDLPFGDPATKSWSFYSGVASSNFYTAKNVIVGTSDEATNASVGIELNATDRAILNARMTTAQKNALTAVDGMQVYDTDLDKHSYRENGAWVEVPAPSTIASFTANWSNADGASKTIVHSLASTDLLVQVWDDTTNQLIEVDSVVRTDSNTLDFTSSEAPASNWRIVILRVS